jgi:hypothetical protein
MVTVASPRPASLRWPEFRRLYPDAWVIVEVVQAVAGPAHRTLARISVLEVCDDPESTVRRYRALRRAAPARELCFLHTAWEAELEERWQFSRELRDTVVTV